MYYDLSLLFIYFFMYAIIGWACEVLYCFKITKELVNRGFLNGPYCPIYGVGALIVLNFLMPYRGEPILVFFIGIILVTSLEYVSSWGMEKLFHAKWWDYSEHKFNINGRVCLFNSLLFGILSLLLIYVVHPLVASFMQTLAPFWIQISASFIAIVFLSDIVESTRETLSFNQKLKSVHETATVFKDKLKEKGIITVHEVIAWAKELKDEKLVDAKDSAQYLFTSVSRQLEETKKINRRSYQRIISAFPKLTHQKHQNALDVYKAYLQKKRPKKEK